jgi:hypothetical protein
MLNKFLYKEVILKSLSILLTDEIGINVGNSNGPYWNYIYDCTDFFQRFQIPDLHQYAVFLRKMGM